MAIDPRDCQLMPDMRYTTSAAPPSWIDEAVYIRGY
jgi:hypothetical protein